MSRVFRGSLYGPEGNSVYLKADGTVELRGGRIDIWGSLMVNGKPYKPCTCGEEGSI